MEDRTVIVAIDPSLTGTAVCIGDERAYRMKVFKSKPLGTLVKHRVRRYRELTNQIRDYIREFQQPREILIEGYSYGSKYSSEVLAEYGGILRDTLVTIAPTHDVAPTTVKKFATGVGNADKVRVASSLAKRYDVEFKTTDEWDAFGLFRLGLLTLGLVEADNQKQTEAAEAVIK